MYVPYESTSKTCIRREDHKECVTNYTKTLSVISLSGNSFVVNLGLCYVPNVVAVECTCFKTSVNLLKDTPIYKKKSEPSKCDPTHKIFART